MLKECGHECNTCRIIAKKARLKVVKEIADRLIKEYSNFRLLSLTDRSITLAVREKVTKFPPDRFEDIRVLVDYPFEDELFTLYRVDKFKEKYTQEVSK